ncbi:MAG: DUF2232 domain-containing protein [Erysipelotrichaceae bacterium]|jgi:uncharacterized protein YybS (DUF2232 family)
MRKSRVNSITYGALFCALVGVLVYINRLLANGLELYFFWIIPIVVIIYIVKFDVKQAIVMNVAMLLMTMIIAGPISTSAFYVLGSVIAGTVYGAGLIKQKSATFLISSVVVVSLVMMFISYFVFAKFFGYDLLAEMDFMKETMTVLIDRMAKGDAGVASTLMSIFDNNALFSIIIISSVLSALLEGFLVHSIAFIVLRRLKMTIPPMKSVSELYAPLWLKLVVLMGLAGNILMNQFPAVGQYKNLIFPITVIAYIVCFMFGYILISTLIAIRVPDARKRASLAVIVLLLSLFLSVLVIGVGIFDIFTSFRKTLIEELKNYVKQDGQA